MTEKRYENIDHILFDAREGKIEFIDNSDLLVDVVDFADNIRVEVANPRWVDSSHRVVDVKLKKPTSCTVSRDGKYTVIKCGEHEIKHRKGNDILDYDTARAIIMLSRRYRRGEPVNLTHLADCRDYFLWETLDIIEGDIDENEVQNFVDELERYTTMSELHGDPFHAGFFFALGQLISLDRGIKKLPEEKISREDFERSWERTKRELGLGAGGIAELN